ncbi:DUF559 domain-containing protein [Cryobacterium sp. W22_MBD10_FK3]|uniref:DUF559 domain-containing protein n=1 Tax=Cryobacterium sp. W22_MBD10_FK3 TaxID=3240273 RepID=UPI003F8E5473
MSKNPSTSKMEEGVRQKLLDAGLKLHKGRSAIQCGYEASRDNHPVLSPDILIKSAKVAVEIDSDFTHADEFIKDQLRNQLLGEVGWTVVRLRLGGLSEVGPHDVLSESTGPTKASIAALIEAIGDAVAGRPGTVRRLTKAVRPKSTKEPSRLGSISPHKYTENAFYVSWIGDGNTIERLVAMDGGNYLAVAEGWGAPRFICWLGLAGVPRTQWRTPLIELLTVKDDLGSVSRFPWGDELFTGEQASNIRIFDKFNAGGADWDATSNLVGVDATDGVAFTAQGKALAQLHDGAVDAGWRLEDLVITAGMYGPYQRFRLVRNGARSKLWALD